MSSSAMTVDNFDPWLDEEIQMLTQCLEDYPDPEPLPSPPTFDQCMYPTVRYAIAPLETLWNHHFYPADKLELDPCAEGFQDCHRLVFLKQEGKAIVDRWLGTNFCPQCNCALLHKAGVQNQAYGDIELCGITHCTHPDRWFRWLTVPENSPRFPHHDRTSFLEQIPTFNPQRVYLILNPHTMMPFLWKQFREGEEHADYLSMGLLDATYYDPFFYK